MRLMINANGYTFDEKGSRFDAVVIDKGHIVAVGGREEISLQYGAQAEVVDLDGATVIPGLVDSHIHLAETGKQASQLNLSEAKSKADLLYRIRNHAVMLPESAWVLGGGWDENRFADKTLPTLAELDEASGGRPLLLTRICHHAYLANSQAFKLSGLGFYPDNPSDGQYGRDGTGRVNGLVYDNAAVPILHAVPPMSGQEWKDALRAGMQSALAAGLTAVHTDDTRSFGSFSDTWLTYRSLIDEHDLRLRIHELVDWSLLDDAKASLPQLAQPDGWLEVGAAKLFSDGAFGGRTAWLSEPYTDSPEWYGTSMYSPEELRYRVRYAHEQGFPVAVHAIGDAALDVTLSALEAAPPVNGRDRVVHAELIRPDLVERMVNLGSCLAIDIQPRFVCSDFPWIVERVGAYRSPSVGAWRTMVDAKLHVCGGSDAPIEPLQPLLGIHAAVTRRHPYGPRPGYFPEQELTPSQAVWLFGQGACYANASDSHKGVIAPGWQADFTVLDRDIVHPRDVDEIRDAKVLYTIVGGQFAYSVDKQDEKWWTA